MSKTQAPTPQELKKAVEAVDEFDQVVQQSTTFNDPLTKSERALLTTFFLYLQRLPQAREPAQ